MSSGKDGGWLTGIELREEICGVLLEALPELKRRVRLYMSQATVNEKDFAVALKIWKGLDTVEVATCKLAQSEMEE